MNCEGNKTNLLRETSSIEMITKQLNGIGALDAPSIDPLQGTQYDFPRDSVGFGRKSLDPEWPNGAKIAVSFVINYEEVYNLSFQI